MDITVSILFERQIAKLGLEMKSRAEAAVHAIVNSTDPASLGVRKDLPYTSPDCPKCVIFAYEINRSYRLLYCVGRDCLTFMRIGDHKAVYRKG